MKWVTKEGLARLTGLTADAIEKYRERGIWLYDVHGIMKDRPQRVWFNTEAIDLWVEQDGEAGSGRKVKARSRSNSRIEACDAESR